jgi:hypothetical protein
MADFQPPSPRGQANNGAASSSSNAETTPAFGGQPIYGRSHRLQSREASHGTTPGQSGRATPNDPEAEVAHRLQELRALRQGQADANANMERFMSMNPHILESMRSSQEELRPNLEERINLFAQHVQVPVMQAVNTSTAAANLTNEMAGAYVAMREVLTRAINAAQQANSAAEANRLETQRQAELSRTALAEATAALAATRPDSTSTTTAERLAAQLADLSTEDGQAPLRPSAQSEFGSRFNATTAAPANVRFMAPTMEAPRMPTHSEVPVGMSIDPPVYKPIGPQVIVIQRAAVELLNHVPTYNG